MAEVRLESVSKRFGDAVAVRDLSLRVQDGEFLVLVGASGCGKSTTLHMVAGLESPTAGDIHIGQRRVNDVDPRDRDVAMVFQNYALYPHMTVFENMAFGLRVRRVPKSRIDHDVREAAEMLGIGELLRRRPSQLSGGQRQRVALGRAIVRRPQVFLMDEPLSNLDAKMRVQMRTEIVQLHRSLGTTVIYVTHDQTEAMTMGHRIAVLRDGTLQQVDAPQELYNHPCNLFVADFVGSPSINLLDCSLQTDSGLDYLAGEGFLVSLGAERRALVHAVGQVPLRLGIRPSDLRLAAAGGGSVARGADAMRGTVDIVEPLGSEQHVLLRTAAGLLTATLPPDVCLATGDALTLAVAPEKAHVFLAESGECIF